MPGKATQHSGTILAASKALANCQTGKLANSTNDRIRRKRQCSDDKRAARGESNSMPPSKPASTSAGDALILCWRAIARPLQRDHYAAKCACATPLAKQPNERWASVRPILISWPPNSPEYQVTLERLCARRQTRFRSASLRCGRPAGQPDIWVASKLRFRWRRPLLILVKCWRSCLRWRSQASAKNYQAIRLAG